MAKKPDARTRITTPRTPNHPSPQCAEALAATNRHDYDGSMLSHAACPTTGCDCPCHGPRRTGTT